MKNAKFIIFALLITITIPFLFFYFSSLSIMNGYLPIPDINKVNLDPNKLRDIIIKELHLDHFKYTITCEIIGPPRKVGVADPKFSVWFEVFDKNKIAIKSGVVKFAIIEDSGDYETLALLLKDDLLKLQKDNELSEIFPSGVVNIIEQKLKNKV